MITTPVVYRQNIEKIAYQRYGLHMVSICWTPHVFYMGYIWEPDGLTVWKPAGHAVAKRIYPT